MLPRQLLREAYRRDALLAPFGRPATSSRSLSFIL
jgi:hypothetical protein